MFRDDLVKVDIYDNELGDISKLEAHSKPILHRAFSVFLINDKGEILIQKRASHKYHSGGLWANACCSHPRKGEDVILSAQNRLKEELGFTTNLKELFNFIYLNKFNDDLFEYELDHVLIGKYNGQIYLNKEETEAFEWVDVDSLSKELVQNPLKFASWFLICAPKVINIVKKDCLT